MFAGGEDTFECEESATTGYISCQLISHCTITQEGDAGVGGTYVHG